MRHAIDQWLDQTKPGRTYRSSFHTTSETSLRAVKWNGGKGTSTESSSAIQTATPPKQTADANRQDFAIENRFACKDAATPPKRETPRSRLSGLLQRVRFFSGNDIEFTSIADSMDTCEPGQLLVYRLGEDCPVELISKALARGAAGILTEQVLPAPIPQAIVGDTTKALTEIRSKQTDRPDQKLITIGIVGSAGKTITSFLTASVLRDIPCRVAYQTGLGSSDSVLTEAGSSLANHGHALIDALSDAVDAGAAVSITELDSARLRSGSYDQIQFDIVLVTGRDAKNNDFGPSAVECAFELAAENGVLIVPAADSRLMRAANAVTETQPVELLTYGTDTNADVSIRTVSREDGVLTAMLRHESRAAVMESHLGNGHFAECLAAAAAVGVVTENSLPQIAESLSKLRELPGRFQSITTGDWETDQTNPSARLDVGGSAERVQFALEAARDDLNETQAVSVPMTPSPHAKTSSRSRRPQLWCVLAVSSADDEETLMQYGRLLETLPDHCVLTCAPADKADFLAISHKVLDGVQNVAAMRLVADPQRAIQWAHGEAGNQDLVLVVGGMDRSNPDRERHSIDEFSQTLIRCAENRHQAAALASETPSLKVVGFPEGLPAEKNITESDACVSDTPEDNDPPNLKLFDGT
ncbi:UDP-N-acetylmuramoyl-L-alanyl-D-glutamate--2,6-diaminopimelate ligase [Rhodopirellula sp. JC740]|uniref:UDP-N-acetylmuramoyl-L-alanyl-D-glutamate--2, 6-diaminopimelate ligase n=1 Tax=Rhodopirellula halodulae TaxID=2894198 RepID=A0ABS8NDF2_9BACT|nr:Mur ligase family protein [Rhodopirellula sp. JC740]MCC9641573.1 UDP-N-acetylmuramoyl-L-alanyl-D-glutamate--2,6-diaminopimelate ligase [Rhodopirellula sp. JC740]